MNIYLRWIPRVIMIAYILFFSLFAFDVLGQEYALFEMMWVFFIHLSPWILFALGLAVAWYKPRTGGSIILVLSIVGIFFFSTYDSVFSFTVISGPPLVAGILFLKQ